MSGKHPTGERLNAYLLGELDADERDRVARHLRACDVCRLETASLEAALAAYRDDDVGEADEAALDRLLAGAGPSRRGPARPRWATVSAAAAAAALIFLGGFWAGQREAGRSSPRAVPARAEAPIEAPPAVDREPPPVSFAVADADLLGGLARRDTTWN